MVAMADGAKAKDKPASNTAHDRTASKVLAEQHAEATRTHRRVAADCGYAARPRAHSEAPKGDARQAFGEATPIVRDGRRRQPAR